MYSMGNIYPVGYKEKYLANTGVALIGEVGNAIYNPGAHCFIKKNSDISVSGLSLISYQGKKFETDETIDSKLAYTAIAKSHGKKSLIFYAESPFAIASKDYYSSTNMQMDISFKLESFYFGVSFSRKFGDSFGLGITTQLVKEKQTTLGNSLIDLSGPGGQKVFNATKYTDKISFIELSFGGLIKVNPDWQLGLKLLPPFIAVDSYSIFQISTMSSAGTFLKTSKEYETKFRGLFDILAGASYQVNSQWQIIFDVGHIFPHKTTSTFLSTQESDVAGQWRVSAGSLIKINSKYTALAGALYKYRSYETSKMVTAGLSYKKKEHEFTWGGFFLEDEMLENVIGVNISTLYNM